MAATSTAHGDATLRIPEGVIAGHGTKRIRAFGLTALALALSLLLYSLGSADEERSKYRTAAVERRTIVQRVEAAGSLDVEDRIDVLAPVPGVLEQVHVRSGDRVRKGDVLGRLREEEAAAQVRAARAKVGASAMRAEQSRVAWRAAADRVARLQRLLEGGLASPREVDAARADEAAARAAVRVAEAEGVVAQDALREAERDLGRRTLTSPSDAVVLVAPEWPNRAVSPEGPAVFVLGTSLDVLRLRADVAEADIGQVWAGQRARFRVPAYPGRWFQAKVTSMQLEGTRRGTAVSYPVLLEAENPSGSLLPGMTATIDVEVGEAAGVLAVPEAALRFVPEGAPEAPPRSRVFVLGAKDELTPVAVTAGLSDGTFTEIRPREGTIQAGARVAIGLATGGAGEGGDAPGITLGKRP